MVSISSFCRRIGFGALAAAVAFSSISQAAAIDAKSLADRASSSDRLVFCHFMIGIVSDRTSSSDYDDDMQRAKAAGIDAFALNIGTDTFTDEQLGYAYESANQNGMKVFISFDFNWWSTGSAASVGQKIKDYASLPGQLLIDGRPFASSFSGDGLDVSALKSAAGSDVYFVPNFHPSQSSSSGLDGAFNWMAWPNDGNNKAPKSGQNVSVADGDNSYESWLGSGKAYMAPISPWFFTHFGPEVSFSKNWVFPGGSLLFDRWNEVLKGGFPMVEIITWNDYGESHYIGPLSSKHYDDGNSKWTNDMPHNGWLDLSKPFIAAFKNKDTDVSKYIEDEQIIYWYRRTLKTLDCDATDTTSGRSANNDSGNYFEGRPNGWETMEDVVYVVSLLKSAGKVTASSGSNTVTKDLSAGANIFTVPAGLGKQTFSLTRDGATVFSDTSLMDITDVCPCGLYNFNAYVGTVPAGASDSLQSDGLSSLTVGLHVTTCQATPSLGTNPSSATQPASQPATTTTAAAPAVTSSSGQVCTAGTVADGQSGNYLGLCEFSCQYGYCPPGPCQCTQYGTANTAPATNGKEGCPIAGEDDSYKGLCSYACNHGYCPSTACEYC